jgi:hypothetical protein
VLISSNSPNYLGLQVSVSSVKTKQENADNRTHLDDCFLKDPSIKKSSYVLHLFIQLTSEESHL